LLELFQPPSAAVLIVLPSSWLTAAAALACFAAGFLIGRPR